MTTETVCVAPIRLRLRPVTPVAPMRAALTVFENEDLVALILQHARLTPREFVWSSRVNKVCHAVCFRDAELALHAARRTQCLTKRALMGLLALRSHEADRLPRATLARRDGGVVYAYPAVAVHLAWDSMVGGVDAWRSRLVERSSEQLAIEVVFGSEWRDVRWAKRQRTWDGRSACAVY